MTVFKDISNNEYVADTEIKLTEGVNGEKSLTGTIYFGNDVKKNLAKGWTMVFNNEEYAIVTFRYNDTDNTVSFSAVQMFFYTLSIKAFHEKWNGSHTLNEYLNAIFKDTGYFYNNETSTAAFEKENWGLKDKLSLFNDIINQISAEFEVKGTTVYIKDKIGSDLSTIVRQGFNLSKAEIETNSSSFATYGVGYGVHDNVDDKTSPRLSVEYYSPLYDMYKAKFGAIEAEPVDDERYTVADNLLNAVKAKVDNSWSLSITVSLLDLQNAGYPYAMASAGDSITIVDESLNFEDEVRIIKVVSSYNISGDRISVDVTCGDLTMAQTQKTSSSVATSTITDIINGNSTLPDAWFSEQMKLATNSILAARTELKFTDQGIIAIDKSDHNKMVILNSAGIGVSTDGGQTFKTAITADGVVADMLYGKLIKGIAFQTANSNGFTMTIQKGRIDFSDTNGTAYGILSSTYDTATGKPNGIALANAPGQIMSINQGAVDGTSSPVFQIPAESTASNRLYNLFGSCQSNFVTDGDIRSQKNSAFWIIGKQQVSISGNDGGGNQLSVYGDHVDVLGDFTVYNGTKNAASVTRDGVRATPAYEMAENWFGDMGESATNSDNQVTVSVDPIFGDIVNTSVQYQVFLQSYSSAHVWVETRSEDSFIVKSDQPNAKFAWELKAKRRGYEDERLVKTDMTLDEVQKIEEGNGTMTYKGGNADGN